MYTECKWDKALSYKIDHGLDMTLHPNNQHLYAIMKHIHHIKNQEQEIIGKRRG